MDETDDWLEAYMDYGDSPACLDCKVNTVEISEYYMVNDSVWVSAFDLVGEERHRFDTIHYFFFNEEDARGVLCIGCLENRLGRQLSSEDFFDCPLNGDMIENGSDRLKDRLGRVHCIFEESTSNKAGA